MKKFLLCAFAAAISIGASAETMRLSSITDVASWGGTDDVTKLEYDSEGRLVKASDDESVCTIDYSSLGEKKIGLTYVDVSDNDVTVFELVLNDDGLVESAKEYFQGIMIASYTFGYEDGYLVNYKDIRGKQTEETRLTYDNGVIMRQDYIDGESAKDNSSKIFEYDGVLNTGNLMLFDELFGVDLDEMEYVAMAGFMGKAPAQLPVKYTEIEDNESEYGSFTWTLDADGYPVKLESRYDRETDVTVFAWEADNAAVGTVLMDKDMQPEYYSIDGHKATSDSKGIVIERCANGIVRKYINM
ncbi:MAG: DUF4595 domain-containing protein [Muribaculaceae bacterium]|nr:DUF4595 domain-containing protein [Muribaculaceae bacterium]MDE6770864.1 DUF4595 domain-containing protein [Muribaculaceae bacterium]